ncbi:unnamed protein product, partial [Symbiodinium sp. KB8]
MGPRKWQRRCIWLIAFPLFHVEAKRAAAFIEDAFEVESLSSYVVFLQTRLHSEPPRAEASRKPSGGALANGSAELRSMTIPKRPSHSSQHSAVAGAGVHPASHNATQALVHTGNHSNISKQPSSSNTLVNKTGDGCRHGYMRDEEFDLCAKCSEGRWLRYSNDRANVFMVAEHRMATFFSGMLAGGITQDALSFNGIGDRHSGAGSQQHSPRASSALPGESAQPASSKASEGPSDRSDRSCQVFWNPYVDSDSEIASTYSRSESGDVPSQPPQPFFSRPGNLPEQAPARPPGIWTKPTQTGSLEGEPKLSSDRPPTTAPARPPGVFHARPSSSSTFNLNAPEFVPQGHAAKSEPPEANK